MQDREEGLRRRPHRLWERSGGQQARSEEFWYAATREIDGDGAIDLMPVDSFEPPIDEPPSAAFQRGAPVAPPGQRFVEQ